MSRRPVLGLDYFAAATHAPGVGRYGRELVRAWLRAEGDLCDLALLEVGAGPARLPASMLGLADDDLVRRPTRHLRLRAPRRATDLLARAVGVDRWLACDAFLRARPDAPCLSRAPSLWAVAQWPEEEQRAGFAAALAANDHLIVFAEAARARLVDEFRVSSDRVHVTPVGADHWRREAEPLDQPPSPRTVLVLGAVEPRRHPQAVLEAFERGVESGLVERLVIVGRAGRDADAFARRLGFSSARARVRWVAEPVECDLPGLVRDAAVLVHVGRGEATAVTPLEALAFGLPVVVDDLPELREALGDRGTYVEPSTDRRRGEAVADALRRALEGDGPDARRRRREHAQGFTWEAAARATSRVVERVVGARRGAPAPTRAG